jgi:hypothetical protein
MIPRDVKKQTDRTIATTKRELPVLFDESLDDGRFQTTRGAVNHQSIGQSIWGRERLEKLRKVLM